MITFLRGILAESLPNRLTIDVNGVGYEMTVPMSADFGKEGESIQILTHLHIREQEHTLFGFQSKDERDLFRLLIDRVSGVGPKVAMAILSAMSPNDFKGAVVAGDLTALASIKGLGKKTAERIVLELKDKIGVTEAWKVASEGTAVSPETAQQNDAVLALISLGYKQAEAARSVQKVCQAPDSPRNTDEIIRATLRLLQ